MWQLCVPFWQQQRLWSVEPTSRELFRIGYSQRGSGRLFFQLLQSNEVTVDVPKQDFEARLSIEIAGRKTTVLENGAPQLCGVR
jgi:hypothetical protein